MKSKHFTTSDGVAFYTETNAINHARTLEDKTVTPPGEVIAEMEVVGATVETGADATGDEGTGDEGTEGDEATQDDEGAKDDAPKTVNISKINKAQLIAFAVDNELTIDETATNAVIIESIEAQLTEKNQA